MPSCFKDKEGWPRADWVLPAHSGAVTCGSKWDISPSHRVGWLWGLLCQGESSHCSPWVTLTSAQGVSFKISLQDVIFYQWNILGRTEKCQSINNARAGVKKAMQGTVQGGAVQVTEKDWQPGQSTVPHDLHGAVAEGRWALLCTSCLPWWGLACIEWQWG